MAWLSDFQRKLLFEIPYASMNCVFWGLGVLLQNLIYKRAKANPLRGSKQ